MVESLGHVAVTLEAQGVGERADERDATTVQLHLRRLGALRARAPVEARPGVLDPDPQVPAGALAIGLVSHVVAADELDATGKALADDMVATAPLGLRLTKEAFWANVDAQGLDAAIALEDRNQILTVSNGDLAEGIAAFLDKRQPDWGRRAAGD